MTKLSEKSGVSLVFTQKSGVETLCFVQLASLE